ncbi:MAG: LPS export ABC transporter periplasmic protein LptC [Verrucomicrobia bacterium]|nr:LPS export ABC transporter periplasmic protein LptC [Verrucomicrobiota bacterium]MCH8512157.1 LPS export ABC transporter periplasmic protein LptC [Kiritimatiellia bacterium]
MISLTLPLALMAQNTTPAPQVRRFRVPEIDENGVMTSMLTGQSARMVVGKPLEIQELAILFYAEDGETVRMKITSPTCLYDDRRGIATSEDEVKIEGDQFTIEGKRFEYRANAQRLEIFEDVTVELRNVMSASRGVLPERNGEADPEETNSASETESSENETETPNP